MTDQAMSPLRRRMIEDMTIRKLAPKIQHDYLEMDCFVSLAMTAALEFRSAMSPDCRTALLCAMAGARH